MILPNKSNTSTSLTLLMKSIVTQSILLNDDCLEFEYEDDYLMSQISKNKKEIKDFDQHVVKTVCIISFSIEYLLRIFKTVFFSKLSYQ
jgi:hypothetical protein